MHISYVYKIAVLYLQYKCAEVMAFYNFPFKKLRKGITYKRVTAKLFGSQTSALPLKINNLFIDFHSCLI